MKFRLRVHISLGTNLLEQGQCDELHDILTRHAPNWSRGLLVQKNEVKRAFDSESREKFAAVVRKVSTSRGPLYQALMTRAGRTEERVMGSAEISGMSPSLSLSLSHDEFVLMRFRTGEVQFRNTIFVSVERNNVEGMTAASWVVRFLSEVCARLDVWHAHAELEEHYEAKNISRANGLQAVGLDVSRHISGLYWLNFFGRPYRALIGADRLLGSPAHRTAAIGEGIMVEVHPDPKAWATARFAEIEMAVVQYIGEMYFFDRRRASAQTLAPDFSGFIRSPD